MKGAASGPFAVKTTRQLEAGDVVALPGRLERTVRDKPQAILGILAAGDEPIYAVNWAEGRTAEWGSGNSGIGSTRWTVVFAACHECAGSGTDAYPCLNVCAYCRGAGTEEAWRKGEAFWARLEAQAEGFPAEPVARVIREHFTP